MKTICDALVTAFQTAFTTTFRVYFHGKQENVALDDLPILMVYPIKTTQRHSGTVRDETIFIIRVELQINLRNYYDPEGGQGTALDSLGALENLVEERDADGDAQSDTVVGIINNNLTIGGNVLYTDNIEVDYSVIQMPTKSQKAKAVITFTAYDRPNRT